MVFKLSSDEALIRCSSARCVRKLLAQGWRLADPSQTEDLLHALADEDERAESNDIPDGQAVRGHHHS